jgi:hypothetical protein
MLVDLAEIVEEYLTGLTCNERGKMGFVGKTIASEFNASCFLKMQIANVFVQISYMALLNKII